MYTGGFDMEKITVWTKQHRAVLETLEREGRYVAKRQFVRYENEDCADLVLEVYDWLVKNGPDASHKPADADYPVWISFSREGTYLPQEQSVMLELSLDPAIITPIHVAKWGIILNYSYIPKDAKDAKRHQELLKSYNTSDTQAYMSQFYPQIKREIIDSWSRLFDDSIHINSDQKYGTIWEIRKEWITDIIK